MPAKTLQKPLLRDVAMAEQKNTPTTRKPIARRLLKWGAITIGTLVVLVIAFVLIVPHLVNLAPVKREIQHVASRSAGRDVTIQGPLSLSLFPWVGFDARDVTMANASGFQGTPFLHANEAKIHVRLFPLIFRDVEVSGITLDQLTLNLVRKANGTNNWQDLIGRKSAPSRQQGPQSVPLAHLLVGEVSITNASINYDDAQAHNRYSLSGVDVRASNIAPGRTFPFHLKLSFSTRQPHVQGTLGFSTQARFDAAANDIALNNGTVNATVSGGGLAHSIDLSARWDEFQLSRNAGTAQIKGLKANVANLAAKLQASASGLNTTPSITGTIRLEQFSPRKFLATLGQPIPTRIRGFDSASLASSLAVRGKALDLSNMTLHLDNTTLTGSAGVGLSGKGPMRFNLNADQINLDHYLPAGAGAAPRAATGHSQRFLETRLPGRLLKDLHVSGRLHVGKLAGLGLDATDVLIALRAANGTVSASPIQARLYGGNYSGTLQASVAGQGIRLNTSQRLSGVDAGRLIAALGKGSRLSGSTTAAVTLVGQGNTVGELLDTLKGRATFSLHNGAVEGLNLWDTLERAYTLVKEHKTLPASGPKRTEFVNLDGSAKIANGVITNDALEAILPLLTVTGHGSADLNKHYLNYDLLAKVVKVPKAAGTDVAKLQGVTIPVHLSGGFTDFTAMPDVKGALQARAKAELGKKLEQQKKAADEKIRKALQDLLNTGGGGGG